MHHKLSENSMDSGACLATIYAVTKSRTLLSDWHTHTHTLSELILCFKVPWFLIRLYWHIYLVSNTSWKLFFPKNINGISHHCFLTSGHSLEASECLFFFLSVSLYFLSLGVLSSWVLKLTRVLLSLDFFLLFLLAMHRIFKGPIHLITCLFSATRK